MSGKEWVSKKKERQGNRRLKYPLKNGENERDKSSEKLSPWRNCVSEKKKELLKDHEWGCYIEWTRVVERKKDLEIKLHILYKTGHEREKSKWTNKREKCIVKKQSSERKRDLFEWALKYISGHRLNNIYSANRKKWGVC